MILSTDIKIPHLEVNVIKLRILMKINGMSLRAKGEAIRFRFLKGTDYHVAALLVMTYVFLNLMTLLVRGMLEN